MKNKIISAPLTMAALLIIILVGVYLVSVMKQSNKATESDTANITNQTPVDPSDTTDTSDTSDTTDNSDSSDETADWQTYTNAEYKYTIKYPTEWIITKVSADESNDQIKIQAPKSSGLIGEPYPSITIFSSLIGRAVVDLAKDCNSNSSLRAQVQFGDEDISRTGASCEDGRYEIFYSEHSKNGQINYWAEATQYGDSGAVELFDQILSTFKFTP